MWVIEDEVMADDPIAPVAVTWEHDEGGHSCSDAIVSAFTGDGCH